MSQDLIGEQVSAAASSADRRSPCWSGSSCCASWSASSCTRSASIPRNIIDSIRRVVRAVWDMGFDAVRWVWRYFLLGAIIVDPDLADRALHARARQALKHQRNAHPTFAKSICVCAHTLLALRRP